MALGFDDDDDDDDDDERLGFKDHWCKLLFNAGKS